MDRVENTEATSSNPSGKQGNRVVVWLSKVLSVIFFPLFLPIYGLAMLLSITFFSYYPEIYVYRAWFFVLGLGVALPFVGILLLRLLRVISEIRLRDKRDRLFPYMLTGFSYVFCAIAFYMLAFPIFVSGIVVGVALALIIDAVVSYFWKISAHLTGVGAVLSGVLITSYCLNLFDFICLASCILICGLVAMARLYLYKHTPGQVLAGFFNGFVCPIVVSLLTPFIF
ncbi:MAG: hypothetical protein J6Y37_04895 [Paludibacteraceae bacterium]|nr:hypothetical protein [Paludibacteraceae bacterium]